MTDAKAPSQQWQGPPLSTARRTSDLLFISGQLPRDASGRLVRDAPIDQARRVLANLSAVLAAHGLGLKDVVKVTAWLTDAAHLEGFNTAYREVFAPPHPARSTVVSGLVAETDIEVEAIEFFSDQGNR
jgi:2-iminobutanoate/2-iminopropanoate deaminase